jgi:hypothetical protein
MVLCPVTRQTYLVCILLKDSILVLTVGLCPEMNSWAFLRVLLRSCHNVMRVNKHTLDCFFIFCLDIPGAGSGPRNWWTGPSLVNSSAVSFPHIPKFLGTHSLTECRVEKSFNTLQHCHTSGDLVAWRAFKVAWPLEKILMYFSDLTFQFHNHRLR